MTILNRYILKTFAHIFGLALASFVGIFLLIDFFEKVDDFIEHGAGASQYLVYFLNNIPVATLQVIPIATLLGTFGCIGGLSRTNELTAIRAGGVNIWRITLPLVTTAMLLSGVVLLANEYLIPLNKKTMHHIMQVELKKRPPIFLKTKNIWLKEGNSIYNIRQSDPEKGRLEGVSIFLFDDRFRMVARRDAPYAIHQNNLWSFHNLTERNFDPSSSNITQSRTLPETSLHLAKKPEDFSEGQHKTDTLSFRELRALANKLQEEGYDPRRYRVDMHAHLAHPLTCLVMAVLGIPFALRKGRGSSLALGVTLSIAVGITYYILQATLLAFGYAGILPPVVAAWAALVIFALIALWLMISARD